MLPSLYSLHTKLCKITNNFGMRGAFGAVGPWEIAFANGGPVAYGPRVIAAITTTTM